MKTDQAVFEAGMKVLFDVMTNLHAESMQWNGDLQEMVFDTDEIVNNLFDDHQRTKERLTELEHAHAALCARLDRLTGQ